MFTSNRGIITIVVMVKLETGEKEWNRKLVYNKIKASSK